MHKIVNSFRITKYQISRLLHNPRLYVIIFCNFIFLWSLLASFRQFLEAYNGTVTPFLFPFLFTHASVVFCFLSGIVILFSNAPFFDRTQMFLTIRTGKTIWAMGQIFYLALGSLMYFGLLYLMSILFLVPHLSFSLEWGSAWNTLAKTDLGLEYGVEIAVSTDMINQFRPLEAIGYTLLMGVLNSVLIGLILFAGNLFFRREVGIAAAMLLILAPYRLVFMPTFLHYIVTTAWMDPRYIFHVWGYKGPTWSQQIMILVGFNVVMVILCIWGLRKKDLPEVEE